MLPFSSYWSSRFFYLFIFPSQVNDVDTPLHWFSLLDRATLKLLLLTYCERYPDNANIYNSSLPIMTARAGGYNYQIVWTEAQNNIIASSFALMGFKATNADFYLSYDASLTNTWLDALPLPYRQADLQSAFFATTWWNLCLQMEPVIAQTDLPSMSLNACRSVEMEGRC